MNIVLRRITPRINEEKIQALIDVYLPEFKVKLKGVRFILRGKYTMVHLPYLLTEKGVKFTPFNFLNNEDYSDFKKSLLDIIQKEYPLAKWGAGIYQVKDEN